MKIGWLYENTVSNYLIEITNLFTKVVWGIKA